MTFWPFAPPLPPPDDCQDSVSQTFLLFILSLDVRTPYLVISFEHIGMSDLYNVGKCCERIGKVTFTRKTKMR